MPGEIKIIYRCPLCGSQWGFIEQFTHLDDNLENGEIRTELKLCRECSLKPV